MILAIFGDFRVFDMTSLMMSLWRHTRLSTSTTHLMFCQSVSKILGGIRPPPGCEMGLKSPALLGLKGQLDKYFYTIRKESLLSKAFLNWYTFELD